MSAESYSYNHKSKANENAYVVGQRFDAAREPEAVGLQISVRRSVHGQPTVVHDHVFISRVRVTFAHQQVGRSLEQLFAADNQRTQ